MKKKKYERQIHPCLSQRQLDKLENAAYVTGIKPNEIIRQLIDSAIPDIDPTDKFWNACKSNGIFKLRVPSASIVPLAAGYFGLNVTGKDEIEGKYVSTSPSGGICPLMWALNNLREIFYDTSKSLPIGSDQRSEPEDD